MARNTLKALFNFMSFNEAKLSMFAAGVIAALTDNLYFPTAAELLAKLVAAQNAYAAALSAATDGSRKQIAEKNVCKVSVLLALRQLCELVNFVAQGDRVKLLSTSFELSKDVVTPSVLVPAKNVVVKYGDTSGQMNVSVKGVKGHKGLSFQYAVANNAIAAADANWITTPSSSTTCTITDMPVGQKVMIRVAIAGSRKQVFYTEPVMKLVA